MSKERIDEILVLFHYGQVKTDTFCPLVTPTERQILDALEVEMTLPDLARAHYVGRPKISASLDGFEFTLGTGD